MKVIIYGTPQCSYCTKAKDLCEQKLGMGSYEYITLDSKEKVDELTERVGRPVRTVPQIFVMSDGFAEYVGGYDDLSKRLS